MLGKHTEWFSFLQNMNLEVVQVLTMDTYGEVSKHLQEHKFSLTHIHTQYQQFYQRFILERMMPTGTDYTVKWYSSGTAVCHMTHPWGLSLFLTIQAADYINHWNSRSFWSNILSCLVHEMWHFISLSSLDMVCVASSLSTSSCTRSAHGGCGSFINQGVQSWDTKHQCKVLIIWWMLGRMVGREMNPPSWWELL